VNVVNSSGWLEYFAGGKNAAFFAGAIATERAHQATLWTQDADFEGHADVRFVDAR
jgi:hypothetical protein